MALRLLSVVCFAFFAKSLGARSRRVALTKTNTSRALTEAECTALSNIIIDGQDFSMAIQLACNLWPTEKLGTFPVNDVNRANQLLQKAMGPGGTWEQIQAIWRNRQSEKFCWRNYTTRLVVASNCEMTFRDTCYGSCPSGYATGLLSGIFSPACTSDCRASSHTYGCGFGCSNGFWSCASTLIEQVSAVASGVGSVYSFLTGDKSVAVALDAIVGFAEFLLQVLPTLVDAVKGGIDIIRDNEEGAMVVIILFQYIAEIAPQIGETVTSIREAFTELADIIADLAAEKVVTGQISVGRIVGDILEHGDKLLDYAVRVTKAFTYSKCAVA